MQQQRCRAGQEEEEDPIRTTTWNATELDADIGSMEIAIGEQIANSFMTQEHKIVQTTIILVVII